MSISKPRQWESEREIGKVVEGDWSVRTQGGEKKKGGGNRPSPRPKEGEEVFARRERKRETPFDKRKNGSRLDPALERREKRKRKDGDNARGRGGKKDSGKT